jgi:hypothetical protein
MSNRTNVRAKVFSSLSKIIAHHARRNLASTLEDKESIMIEPMTQEEGDEFLRKFIADLRKRAPPLVVLAEPINLERLRALRPGKIYEGFEEDVKRMRRGLEPLGPRE